MGEDEHRLVDEGEVKHEITTRGCTCGAKCPLGLSINRWFDKHLLTLRSDVDRTLISKTEPEVRTTPSSLAEHIGLPKTLLTCLNTQCRVLTFRPWPEGANSNRANRCPACYGVGS